MKKKHRLTKNQQDFKKEISRLKKGLSSYKKKGYMVNEIIFPMPKRVTQKSLNEIKVLKPKQVIRDYATLVEYSTGEIIYPQSKSERVEAEKKNIQIYENIRKVYPQPSIENYRQDYEAPPIIETPYLDNLIDALSNAPEFQSRYLLQVIDEAVSRYGEFAVNQKIKNMDDSLIQRVSGAMTRKEFSDVVEEFDRQMLREFDTSEELIKEYEKAQDEQIYDEY